MRSESPSRTAPSPGRRSRSRPAGCGRRARAPASGVPRAGTAAATMLARIMPAYTPADADEQANSLRRARPRAVRRPGLGDRRGPHAGLHERGVARPHPRDRRGAFLEPLARGALAQGRDVGQRAAAEAAPLRLRRRRARRAGRAARPRLPHRRALLLPPRAGGRGRARARRPRGARGARAHPRRAAARAPGGSYTVELLDDPERIGAKVREEADEVARAAARRVGRARRRGGRRRPLPPRRFCCARATSRSRACWRRSMAVAAEPGTRRAGRRALRRRLRDAGLGVPEAARGVRRARRTCSSRPSRAGSGRYSFLGLPARTRPCAGRSATTATPTRLAADLVAGYGVAHGGDAAVPRRRGRLLRLRPRPHRRAARRAEPRPARPARHGADGLRADARLRPPEARAQRDRVPVRRRTRTPRR